MYSHPIAAERIGGWLSNPRINASVLAVTSRACARAAPASPARYAQRYASRKRKN